MGSAPMRNWPVESLGEEREKPVAVFVTVTVAPGTARPCWSVT